MLRRMHALRLAAAATVAAAALVAAALGACDNVIMLTDCAVPTLDEKGADGGPDPCHCDPPASSSVMGCGCLSDPTDQGAIDDLQTCTALVRVEEDAGDAAGP
jgi:hypothetical protein